MSDEKPSDEQLRAAARKSYGTSCSQIHCKAGGGIDGGDRDLVLPNDLQASRDEEYGGTWISARIWIPDADAKP